MQSLQNIKVRKMFQLDNETILDGTIKRSTACHINRSSFLNIEE